MIKNNNMENREVREYLGQAMRIEEAYSACIRHVISNETLKKEFVAFLHASRLKMYRSAIDPNLIRAYEDEIRQLIGAMSLFSDHHYLQEDQLKRDQLKRAREILSKKEHWNAFHEHLFSIERNGVQNMKQESCISETEKLFGVKQLVQMDIDFKVMDDYINALKVRLGKLKIK